MRFFTRTFSIGLILTLFLETAFAGHSKYRSSHRKRRYHAGYSKSYPVYGADAGEGGSGVTLGIKGGLHFASVGLSTESTGGTGFNSNSGFSSNVNANSVQSFIKNFTGGMIINISLREKLSLQPEINYIQKGFIPNSNPTASLTMNYLEVPIMLRGAYGSDNVKFLLLVGPTLGYALNGNSTNSNQSESISFDENDGFKRFDFGIAGGAGLGIKLGETMLVLEGRYQQSITPIQKNPDGDDKVVSVGYNFALGFMFPMGH